MLGVGQTLPDFRIIGVKPGFNSHEENGVSAFEPITGDSFEGKRKVIFFYPKDFTFVCPTEIAEFASLARDFNDRDTVVMGGSTDNEFVKLAWRRDHADLSKLPIWQFADNGGKRRGGDQKGGGQSAHARNSLNVIRTLQPLRATVKPRSDSIRFGGRVLYPCDRKNLSIKSTYNR